MAAWAESTHPRAPRGEVSSRGPSLHGTSLPSCFCVSVLSHSSSTCAATVLGTTRTGSFLPSHSLIHGRADSEAVTASNVQKEILEIYISVGLETNNKKHNEKKETENYWLCCFCSFALMSFEVNVCQMSE